VMQTIDNLGSLDWPLVAKALLIDHFLFAICYWAA